MLCCARLATALCCSRVPNLAGATHQIDHHSRTINSANLGLLRTSHFFCDFYVESSSRCSLVCILPTSSSKSAPNVTAFIFLSANRSLASVRRTFCRPHLPKVLRPLLFVNILKCKSISRYSARLLR